MLETGFYAGILAIFYIYLAVRVIKVRRRTKTKLGDGGNEDLMNAIRAHGNFAEYVPFALLLMAILNQQGLAPAFIHVMGSALVLGRIIHAYSITKDILKLRPVGMGMTFTVIFAAAVLLILKYLTV
ncbi:MAG: glutathione metabolism protein [Proteobacteria bacterium]|nr:glutathione metabolism protein [Pseudomonadota bacterium]